MRRAGLGLALAAVALPGVATATMDRAFGYWLTENEKAIIQLYGCGDAACGKIVWLAEPLGEDGAPKTDKNNPDPAMQDRLLCGLELIGGLRRAEQPGDWEGGAIYNSQDGAEYSVEVMTEAWDMLEVRGYLGVSLLGKSQVWTRVPSDRGGCPISASEG